MKRSWIPGPLVVISLDIRKGHEKGIDSIVLTIVREL